MPIPAIIAGGSALIGGLAGRANKRPPSLTRTQSSTLEMLLKDLYPQTKQTGIDPIQQGLLFDEIARSGRGAETRLLNRFASRGLRGGLVGQGLSDVSGNIQQSQNVANLGLQQQSITQRNQTIQQILALLGVQNIPGQSGLGAFLGGAAGPLAYALTQFGRGGGGGIGSLSPSQIGSITNFPGGPGVSGFG